MRKSSGFTLVETVFAISLITLGTGSIFSLIQKSHALALVAERELEATYLAQEGVEIVRNIRDSNWLAGINWDSNIAADCIIPRPSPCDLYGDVDRDGVVTQEDADLIANSVSNPSLLDAEQRSRADVDGNGTINVVDALKTAQYASCLPTPSSSFATCNMGIKFQRAVTVSKPEAGKMIVSSTVSRTGMPTITVQTELYDWR